MGNLLSRLTGMFGPRNVKLCMLGLDAAGKTSLLYKLHLGELVTTIPTIGFNVERVSYKNLSMTIWDVGGQERLRRLWKHYFTANDGIVFVVDSADTDRFGEVRHEMMQVLENPELRGVPLLIYANKQDLPTAASCTSVRDALGLSKIRDREWYLQGASTLHGDGVFEGLDWLAGVVKSNPPSHASVG